MSYQLVLARIKKDYPLLTAEQEKELFEKLEKGDKNAETTIYLSNLRMVASVIPEVTAKYQYAAVTVDYDDLFQVGCIGLQKAIQKFDVSRGYRFSTYAVWWIKQEMLRYADEMSHTVHVPPYILQDLRRVYRTRAELEQECVGEPTKEQMVEKTGMPFFKIEGLKGLNRILYPSSIEQNREDALKNGRIPLTDLIEDKDSLTPDQELDQKIIREAVDALLSSTLTPREQTVITLRYGLDSGKERTLQEVGKVIGVTRERVRQIECRAERKLRKTVQAQHPSLIPDSVDLEESWF